MRRTDNLTTFACRLSRNLEASTSWNPPDLNRDYCNFTWFFQAATDILLYNRPWPSISVAVRSKVWFCGRSIAWIGILVPLRTRCSPHVFVVCCVGSTCDELITLSEESYRLCVCVCVCVYLCLAVCYLGTSTKRRPRPQLGCCTTVRKSHCIFPLIITRSFENL